MPPLRQDPPCSKAILIYNSLVSKEIGLNMMTITITITIIILLLLH